MSARQGDWHLLGHDSDPVPTDAYEIADQGRHYKSVARTLRLQAQRLRRLAEPGAALEGHYAEGLRHSCRELADHLELVEGRFETTGGQLEAWSADVSTARYETGQAVQEAEDAHRRVTANQPQDVPPGTELTPAQELAAQERARQLTTADGDLARARERSNRAMASLDERAEEVARRIRAAADDDMKDSRWDRFKGAVERISGVLGVIRDLLGVIAIVLVVASLFIPGLNVLVAALILGVSMLAISSLLAATGNGSWLDVAFDVVGLATLGLGRVFTGMARAGRAAALSRSSRVAGGRARVDALRAASFNGGRGFLGRASMTVQRFLPSTRAAMRSAADDAAAAVRARPVPSAGPREALRAGGSREIAGMRAEVRALRQEFGLSGFSPSYSVGVGGATATGRVALGAMGSSSVADPPFTDWSPVPGYNAAKDRLTEPIGGPF